MQSCSCGDIYIYILLFFMYYINYKSLQINFTAMMSYIKHIHMYLADIILELQINMILYI